MSVKKSVESGAVDESVFNERKARFKEVHDELTSRGASSRIRTPNNEQRLVNLLRAWELPWFPPYDLEEYVGRFDVHTNYGLQAFFSTLSTHFIHGDSDLEDICEALAEEQDELENGVGKPSATDGSKGQWKSWKKSTIRAYLWVLGEWDGYQAE